MTKLSLVYDGHYHKEGYLPFFQCQGLRKKNRVYSSESDVNGLLSFCQSCSDTVLSNKLNGESKYRCLHSTDYSRQITVTCLGDDLRLAISLGYRIRKVFEIHVFENKEPHEGLHICANFFMEMRLKQEKDKFLRNVVKSTALAGLGKFAQKNDSTNIICLNTASSLEVLIKNKTIKYFDIQRTSSNLVNAFCTLKNYKAEKISFNSARRNPLIFAAASNVCQKRTGCPKTNIPKFWGYQNWDLVWGHPFYTWFMIN